MLGQYNNKHCWCLPEVQIISALDVVEPLCEMCVHSIQMVNTYQPEDQLFCVRASYELLNPDDQSVSYLIVYVWKPRCCELSVFVVNGYPVTEVLIVFSRRASL